MERPLPANPLSALDADGAPQAPMRRGRGPTRLGQGLVVDGNVLAGEDLIVDGRITGGLHVPDHAVTVGPTGTVRGRIFGRVVLIEGTVSGDVTASGHIDIAEGAHVEADLAAPAVAIAEGAWFTGHIDMRRAEAAARVARYRIERSGDTKPPEHARPAAPSVN